MMPSWVRVRTSQREYVTGRAADLVEDGDAPPILNNDLHHGAAPALRMVLPGETQSADAHGIGPRPPRVGRKLKIKITTSSWQANRREPKNLT
jgi:hypothetical protein